MTKKKLVWRSHEDGSHYLIPDKGTLPKGNMKQIDALDEAIDSEREITGEEYAQELYPEEYETQEETEDMEIIKEIESEKREKDNNAFKTRAESRLKDIGEKIEEGGIKGEGKANELGVKLRREIRKMILKRQLKEQEDKS